MSAPPSSEPLRVLLLEDSEDDAALVWRELRRCGFAVEARCVDTEPTYIEQLRQFGPQLVLSDYALPGYDGMAALSAARQYAPNVPFIFVSGMIGEEVAIEALQRGATDYVIKDRLGRLGPAVRRALELTAEQNQRRRAEQQLRAKERHFRALIEHAQDLITLVDRVGVIRFQSRSSERLGYAPRQLEGRSFSEFVHEEDRPQVDAALDAALSRAAASLRPLELRFRAADGTWRVLESVGRGLIHDDEPAVVFNSRDITDRRALEAQIQHAQKMESVGRLAGGVAHDFNNLLTVILASVGFAARTDDLRSARRELDHIRTAAERAAALTRQLLTFSRKQLVRPAVIDVNGVLEGAAALLRRLAGERIDVVLRLGRRIGRVRADAGQIEQVLLNLVINASDAMPAGGTLTIETGAAEIDARHVATYP